MALRTSVPVSVCSAAQLIDWQNAVFLLFMPLMLAVASTIFRFAYIGMGIAGQVQSLSTRAHVTFSHTHLFSRARARQRSISLALSLTPFLPHRPRGDHAQCRCAGP